MSTGSSETERRRQKQLAYNKEHGLKPRSIRKTRAEILQATSAAGERRSQDQTMAAASSATRPWARMLDKNLSPRELVTMLQEAMEEAAANLEFEEAAVLRDRIEDLRAQWPDAEGSGEGERK